MSSLQQTPQLRSEQSELTLLGLWRIVWRQKVLIGIISTAFIAVAVALALLATPIYRATVVVTEAASPGQAGSSGLGQLSGLASLVGVAFAPGASSQDARVILESRHLVKQFVERNHLIPVLYPDAEQPPGLWFAVDKFQRKVLSIRDDSRTGAKVIAIDWTDPQVAARWANEFVALANELIRARALDVSSRNIAYLRKEIERTSVVEMQQVMYNLIENEMKTVMLANGRLEYAFTVIDPAVAPAVRFSPKRTLMVLFGALLGLCVGASAAIWREFASRAPVRS